MSVFGWLSFTAQVVGLAIVLAGLYRRDPASQRAWARAKGRVRFWVRRLLRHDTTVRGSGGGTAIAAVTTSARGYVGPRPRDPRASLGERVAWLEDAVDAAYSQIRALRDWTTEDVNALRKGVADVRRDHDEALADLGRRLDEAGVPEHLEWWGAALVGLGLLLGVLDGLVIAATEVPKP